MNEEELILTEILNCNRAELYLKGPSLSLSNRQQSLLSSIKKERSRGAPLQYLLGKCEFFGLEFKVCPGVFIPRPETEILVERAITIIGNKSQRSASKILDIGTGSGNIAISLAKYIKNAQIIAVDICERAIEVAKENARLHRVREKIDFLRGNFFLASSHKLPTINFDVIVSNPPYIRTKDIEKLAPEVKSEPRIALDGGEDGLEFYLQIISQAQRLLRPSGALLFEIGYDQSSSIRDIINDFTSFKLEEIVKDYNGVERVAVLRMKD